MDLSLTGAPMGDIHVSKDAVHDLIDQGARGAKLVACNILPGRPNSGSMSSPLCGLSSTVGSFVFSDVNTTRLRNRPERGILQRDSTTLTSSTEEKVMSAAVTNQVSMKSLHPQMICFASESSGDSPSITSKSTSGPGAPPAKVGTHPTCDGNMGIMVLEPTPLLGMDAVVVDDEGACDNNLRTVSRSSIDNASASSVRGGKKRVRWHSIQTREFSLVVGDHPLCQDGLPVSLGWHYADAPPVPCSHILRSPITSPTNNGPKEGLAGFVWPASPSTNSNGVGIRIDYETPPSSSAPQPVSSDMEVEDDDAGNDDQGGPTDSRDENPTFPATSAAESKISERLKSYVFPRRLSYEERCQRLCRVSGWTMEEVQREEVDLVVRTLKESWEHLDDEHIVAPISPTTIIGGAADDAVGDDSFLEDMMALDDMSGLDCDLADMPDMDWFESL